MGRMRSGPYPEFMRTPTTVTLVAFVLLTFTSIVAFAVEPDVPMDLDDVEVEAPIDDSAVQMLGKKEKKKEKKDMPPICWGMVKEKSKTLEPTGACCGIGGAFKQMKKTVTRECCANGVCKEWSKSESYPCSLELCSN